MALVPNFLVTFKSVYMGLQRELTQPLSQEKATGVSLEIENEDPP